MRNSSLRYDAGMSILYGGSARALRTTGSVPAVDFKSAGEYNPVKAGAGRVYPNVLAIPLPIRPTSYPNEKVQQTLGKDYFVR